MDTTPKHLRDQAEELDRQAKELRDRAFQLRMQADRLEGAQMEVGMTVFIARMPIDLIGATVNNSTLLRLDKVGRKNAVVSRVDGEQFILDGRPHRQIQIPKICLRLSPPK